MEKLPISVLAVGDVRALVAAISHDTGIEFSVALSWVNTDGSLGRRNEQVSI